MDLRYDKFNYTGTETDASWADLKLAAVGSPSVFVRHPLR